MRLRGLYLYILQSFACEKFLVWRELFRRADDRCRLSETERVILYYKVLPVQ